MILRTCIRPLALTATLALALGSFQAFAQEAAAPPAAQATGEKVKLELNLTKGQKFDTAVKMTMAQNMNVGGMDMSTDIEMSVLQTNSVEALDDAGVATMKTKVRRITGSFSNPMMGQIEFDSDKKDEAESGNPMMDQMTKQFTAEAGKEHVVKLAKDGTTSSGAKDDPSADAMRAMGGINKLPKDPVGVGDSWTNETEGTTQGMQTKTKMKTTVKSIDADTITVTHEGTLELSSGGDAGETSANPMARMASKMKMKATKIVGESKISRKDGYILVSDVTSDMEMEIPADENAENPMLAGGMTMTMKQKVHQERKPASADAAAPATPSEPEKK